VFQVDFVHMHGRPLTGDASLKLSDIFYYNIASQYSSPFDLSSHRETVLYEFRYFGEVHKIA